MSSLSNSDQNDCIAAVATGSSDAGIGIIRISGSNVLSYVGPLIRSSQPCMDWKANTIHYAHIVDPETQEPLDEVMISWMKAPHSYTCEDTVEINTHGGQYVMQRVLAAVLRTGIRPAEPGEFTKRAFLNGRIDLSEAEAVMDLIHAQNEFSRKTALSQLGGSVSAPIQKLRSDILHETAFIEAALDDPEHYSLDDYPPKLLTLCEQWTRSLHRILSRSEDGMILRSGIAAVIAGKPNSGKSSFMNSLIGRERAIVTDIPGTTRDTLEETVRLGDLVLRLTDTAGIRSTEDVIERIGVERSRKAVDTAQLIFFLVDSSSPLSAEDDEIAELVAGAVENGCRCIVLLTKSDLPVLTGPDDVIPLLESHFSCLNGVSSSVESSSAPAILPVSSKTGFGMDLLVQEIHSLFLHGEIQESSEWILSGERQMSEVRLACSYLQLVENGIRDGFSEDLYSIDLINAYNALGRVLGVSLGDDLIDEIFSQFCMGK